MKKILFLILPLFFNTQFNSAAPSRKKWDGAILTFANRKDLLRIKRKILDGRLNVLHIQDQANELTISFTEPQSQKSIMNLKYAVERIVENKVKFESFKNVKIKENNAEIEKGQIEQQEQKEKNESEVLTNDSNQLGQRQSEQNANFGANQPNANEKWCVIM